MAEQRSEDPRLSEIRRVTLYYLWDMPGAPHAGDTRSYLILAREVDQFVEATKRLHYSPGCNPHNGQKTTRIWKITMAMLGFEGPFWWTTPDLQNNFDSKGAHTIDSYHEHVLWIDADVVRRWRAEEEAEEYNEL